MNKLNKIIATLVLVAVCHEIGAFNKERGKVEPAVKKAAPVGPAAKKVAPTVRKQRAQAIRVQPTTHGPVKAQDPRHPQSKASAAQTAAQQQFESKQAAIRAQLPGNKPKAAIPSLPKRAVKVGSQIPAVVVHKVQQANPGTPKRDSWSVPGAGEPVGETHTNEQVKTIADIKKKP